MCAWVTRRTDEHPHGNSATRPDDRDITLYVDVDTRTRFPADALIPLAKLREALLELAETGQRPTCVHWQESDVS
ncbi:Imm1 family immunity protein [Lentzea sp. NPDC042327]|uniref:Imm1 family immunity protein n=1 Tax=Lentzea sp. NPDC042327 TaxID=3154801 RepID=UPI00340D684E